MFFSGCSSKKWYESERYSIFKKGSSRSEIVSTVGVPTKSYVTEDDKGVDLFYFREIDDRELQIKFADISPNGVFTIRQPKMEFHYIKAVYDYEGIVESVEFSEPED
jgi:hypothetical protein